MSRLLPVNRAVCPKCRKKTTRRVGFSQQQRGSLWTCEDCGEPFVVPLLQLARGRG